MKSSKKQILYQSMIVYELVITIENVESQVHIADVYNGNFFTTFFHIRFTTKVRVSNRSFNIILNNLCELFTDMNNYVKTNLV